MGRQAVCLGAGGLCRRPCRTAAARWSQHPRGRRAHGRALRDTGGGSSPRVVEAALLCLVAGLAAGLVTLLVIPGRVGTGRGVVAVRCVLQGVGQDATGRAVDRHRPLGAIRPDDGHLVGQTAQRRLLLGLGDMSVADQRRDA